MNDLKGPSLFEIKQFIRNKSWITFHTINDRIFKGQIIWFDDDTFHISLENNQKITILRHAVIFYSKDT